MPRYTISPSIPGGAAPLVFGAWDTRAEGFDEGRDQVLLGRLNESGPRRSVLFDLTRETVVALFGKRGSGKSYSLGVMIESLATREHHTSIGVLTRGRAVLLLDTLSVFWSTANPLMSEQDLARFPSEVGSLRRWGIDVPDLDVEIWMPARSEAATLSDLYREFTIGVSALTEEDVQDLFGVDAQGPSGQLLADAWSRAAEVRSDFDFDDVLQLIEGAEDLAEYYSDGTRRAIRQRLRHFAANPVFTRHGTPLTELLVPGRAAILEMGALEDHQRTVLSAVLLRQVHRARQEAATLEKQLGLNTRLSDDQRAAARSRLESLIPPAWIMVDEAQTLFPADRTTHATDAFVRFVKEGRNFGLSFALTTQQPSAVDQRVLSQVDTVICHQLTVEADITRMRDNMKSAMPNDVAIGSRKLDVANWLRSLEPGQAMVTNSDFERAFCVEIRPRVCPHAGSGFRFEPAEAALAE